MSSLSTQRCFQHASREAVARCPECRRMYCRECVTEHGDRMLCATCIGILRDTSRSRTARLPGLVTALRCGVGVVLCFAFFYTMGRFLLTMPTTYHEGTLWQQSWNRVRNAAQGE